MILFPENYTAGWLWRGVCFVSQKVDMPSSKVIKMFVIENKRLSGRSKISILNWNFVILSWCYYWTRKKRLLSLTTDEKKEEGTFNVRLKFNYDSYFVMLIVLIKINPIPWSSKEYYFLKLLETLRIVSQECTSLNQKVWNAQRIFHPFLRYHNYIRLIESSFFLSLSQPFSI